MRNYEHILFATDLKQTSIEVGARAVELAHHYQATFSMFHVVEYIPLDLANELVIPQYQQIEEQLVNHARTELKKLAQSLGVSECKQFVEVGPTKSEILRFAEERDVDLIVLGRHSHHGVAVLLGSTATGVINRAPCDVIAVKVGT